MLACSIFSPTVSRNNYLNVFMRIFWFSLCVFTTTRNINFGGVCLFVPSINMHSSAFCLYSCYKVFQLFIYEGKVTYAAFFQNAWRGGRDGRKNELEDRNSFSLVTSVCLVVFVSWWGAERKRAASNSVQVGFCAPVLLIHSQAAVVETFVSVWRDRNKKTRGRGRF